MNGLKIEQSIVDELVGSQTAETLFSINHEKEIVYVYSNDNETVRHLRGLAQNTQSDEITILFDNKSGLQIAFSQNMQKSFVDIFFWQMLRKPL